MMCNYFKGGNMIKKILGMGILLSVVAGCSTTKAPSDLSRMQIKVGQLERGISDRDQTIADLKYEVESLSAQVNALRSKPRSKTIGKSSRTTKSSTTSSKSGIIRVSASSKQVQSALKNAGYYSGPIDGKVGGKTKLAISEFQKDHDLTTDGIIGKKTWAELKYYIE